MRDQKDIADVGIKQWYLSFIHGIFVTCSFTTFLAGTNLPFCVLDG